MKNLFRAVLAAAFAVTILATASASASAAQGTSLPPAMLGHNWYLVTIDYTNAPTTNLTSGKVLIKFADDGTMTGSGGCNSFGGQFYGNATGAIKFSQIISTMMACADENVNQVEGQYMRALNSVTQYKPGVDTLLLIYDNGQGTLTFTSDLSAAQGGVSVPGIPATGAASDIPLWIIGLGALVMLLGLALLTSSSWLARQRQL